MSRIERRFDSLKRKGEKALIVYLTAGDPSLDITEALVLGLDAAGTDVVEIGVPFSDPTADGPIIQAASQRALRNGVTLSEVLNGIEKIRQTSQIPIVLFGYYNPIFCYGNQRFAKRARDAGVDGILVVDLPLEESDELRRHTDQSGVDFISLIAPTTNAERIRQVSTRATGFLYYISITGVTGTAKPQFPDMRRDVERIRGITSLPLVVGFGITAPQQAEKIAPFVDGIVIGSAFVRMIEENRDKHDLVHLIADYARAFKARI
jgi:tryptophan synthase alpha chain